MQTFCKRRRVKPQQLSIPSDQLAVNEKPFSNSGLDYFGPVLIKSSRRTRLNPASTKRYIVLFTCLTTRAVHLELAHDMPTDAFLLALHKFISRRGFVKVLRSDSDSNFIVAEKELKEALKQLNHVKIIDVMSRQNIEWKFNPPIWMEGFGNLWSNQ